MTDPAGVCSFRRAREGGTRRRLEQCTATSGVSQHRRSIASPNQKTQMLGAAVLTGLRRVALHRMRYSAFLPLFNSSLEKFR